MALSESDRSNLIQRWTLKSSTSEQQRMDRAERMVRDAIDKHPPFSDHRRNFTVYVKGSYANETNVRRDSDVDVVVENHEVYYSDYIDTKTALAATPEPDSVPYQGPWTPKQWRDEVEAAICNYFGAPEVDTSGAIAMTVAEVEGSRPSADIVPAFFYRRYDTPDRSAANQGSKVYKKDLSGTIINYPNQQLRNGNARSVRTSGKYKEFARALKNGENALVSNGLMEAKPSYLMECLAYNVPDRDLTVGFTHSAWFQHALATLFNALLPAAYSSEEWVEPNELKYLFGPGQKWTVADAREFAGKLWDYLEYP